ncbi:MAG TPA: sensor histidine kinase [Streptosporangiaceae bacterium]|nr:sensor histidine kinase [Streptosporangiaceae bacterium]
MSDTPAGRRVLTPRRVLRPPVREVRFWVVQAMIAGIAALHLAIDVISAEPGAVPAGIPVALLLVPVSYAALQYGLSGSVATAAWAAVLWLPDLLLPHDRGHVGNDVIELALVIAVAVFVGYHIDGERRARAHVRHLTGLLLQVQEEERRRIAHELHDEPLQLLAHLARSLDLLETAPSAPAILADGLGEARSQALDIAGRLRAVVAGLRPPALEQLGLTVALRGFLADVGEASAVHTDLQVTGEENRLPPEVELGAFRIAQEAVSNVIRHAGARKLVLTLAFEAPVLRLRVADDGCGFDPGTVNRPSPSRGLGMLSMRERAEIAGGRLTIRSAPGEGTVVEATLKSVSAPTD